MSANLMIVEDGERVRGAMHPAVTNEGYDVAMAEAALTRPCACAIGVPGLPLVDSGPGGGARWVSPDSRIVAAVRGLGYLLDVQR
ncbi:hypothetical protein AB0M34_13365 [Nocardia sp. NPDC050193]